MKPIDFVNGTTIFLPNCANGTINCTLFDAAPNAYTRRKAKRLIDTSFNANVQARALRQIHQAGSNTWYVRTQDHASGGPSLGIIRSPRNIFPILRTEQPQPINPEDEWSAGFIIPPWVFREFAATRLSDPHGPPLPENIVAGIQNLNDMFTAGSATPVDPILRQIINDAGNLYGADNHMLRLRGLGLAATTADELARTWRENHIDPGTVRVLEGVENDMISSVSDIIARMANRIGELYNSDDLGRLFMNYADTLHEGYMFRAFTLNDLSAYVDGEHLAEDDAASDSSSHADVTFADDDASEEERDWDNVFDRDLITTELLVAYTPQSGNKMLR